MAESFVVRGATLADYREMCGLLAEVDELHRSNLPWMFEEPAVEPRSRQFFEQLLGSPDSAVLVADSGAQLIGVAAVLMRSAPDFAVFVRQSWAVLDNIAVANSWRRRGVGTALIRDAERWAVAHGAKWLELGVYEFNDDARAFYGALGYGPVSTKLRKPFLEPLDGD